VPGILDETSETIKDRTCNFQTMKQAESNLNHLLTLGCLFVLLATLGGRVVDEEQENSEMEMNGQDLESLHCSLITLPDIQLIARSLFDQFSAGAQEDTGWQSAEAAMKGVLESICKNL
jgi:hypothetical protein